jgi:glycosyltransferase involved in cell wall biosynthesis
MPPRFSVLLPAFNADPYVAAAVESVRAQTFDDWEIVAVDDASTDRTLEVLRSFADSRMRLKSNERNLGMTANWNRCLSQATGEIVLKLDADDVLKPRALEMLHAAMEDANVVAAGMRSLQCDESLEPFDGIQGDDAMLRGGIHPYRDAVHEGGRWYDIAAMGFQLWSSSAFAFRRGVVAGWDERFGCASDTELMLRTMELGKPLAHRGAVGALYRVRPGSISDEYRSRGWLTWEGVAANLLSMSRVRTQRPLKRALRMHYVRLWRRWHGSTRELPESICSKLEDVVRDIPAPPVADTVMTRMRDAVSA